MRLISTLLLGFISFSSQAQNTGFIDYDIEIKGITPELDKGAVLLNDSHMRIAFTDSAVRQDYRMGQFSTKTTILNKKYNQAIYYENGMGGKVGVVGTYEQIASMAVMDTNSTVEITTEKKTILNYACTKAIIHFTSGEKADYWFTDKIDINVPRNNFFNPKIPGIILEFSTVANGYFMRFKCSNYGTEIEDLAVYFAPFVTRDYKMIDFSSYLQLIEMQKQQAPK